MKKSVKMISALALVVILVSCTAYKDPFIVDISPSKVVVQKDLMANTWARNIATNNDVIKVAQKGCREFNERAHAVGLSEKCGSFNVTAMGITTCISTHYIFACKKRKPRPK